MTMMSAFETTMNDGLLVKESQANDFPTIPGGKYPASLVKVEDRSNDQKESYDDGKLNPLYGKPVANLQVKLEGVGEKGYSELDGKARTHFIKVCPAIVHDAKGKLIAASRLAGHMIAVSGTQGKSFAETLAWFQENKFQVSVGVFNTPDGRTINTTSAITSLE
jgi:hypothetical protein